MKTMTRGALSLLVVAGLLLYAGSKWSTDAGRQEGVERDRRAGPEKTFDDRQRHEIQILVRYRPARGMYINWMIGEDGDIDQRGWGDRPEWTKIRTNIPEGVVISLMVDNEREGGYVNCEIRMDDQIMRHHTDEKSPAERTVCDLTYVVGDR